MKLSSKSPNLAERTEYRLLHRWVESELGKPKLCSNCGIKKGSFDWSNISGKYKKDIADWVRMCHACHIRKDLVGDPNLCLKGHELTRDNIYTRPGTRGRTCKKCRKDYRIISNLKRKAA